MFFRNARKVKGSKATYEELVITMNHQYAIPNKYRSILSLHRLQLY